MSLGIASQLGPSRGAILARVVLAGVLAGFVELVVYWWTTDFRLGLVICWRPHLVVAGSGHCHWWRGRRAEVRTHGGEDVAGSSCLDCPYPAFIKIFRSVGSRSQRPALDLVGFARARAQT